MSSSTQAEREFRHWILKEAKSVLYRKDSTDADIEYVLGKLPTIGHKAMGLRARLELRLAGEPYGWDDIG
jgi:hypothetical protein